MTTDALFDLTGRVAVVTGGSRGLGREMVLAFAAHGADVVIASRKLDGCEAVAREVEALGRRALPVAYHAGDWDDSDRLYETVYEQFGRCDVLVNNAGMSPLYESVDTDQRSAVRQGARRQPQRPVPPVGARRDPDGRQRGRRVDHLRVVGRVAAPIAERAGLRRSQGGRQQPDVRAGAHARAEGARQLHRAGPVPHRHLQGVGHGPLHPDRHDRRSSLGRGGEPGEIVGAALYLASDASSYTTGTTINVDGGPR